MLICKACLAARGVIRDVDTNTMSIFSILEQLSGAGFPLFIQEIAVYAFWKRESKDPPTHDVVFSVSLNGTVLHTTPVTLTFGNTLNNRLALALNGLVITGPGDLLFEFTHVTTGVRYGSHLIVVTAPTAVTAAAPARATTATSSGAPGSSPTPISPPARPTPAPSTPSASPPPSRPAPKTPGSRRPRGRGHS
jgi:hypothetical protein